MALLTDERSEERLAQLDDWVRKGNEIERVFKFKDFAEAMVFVNRVADLAEQANHHPDIAVSWNKVTLTLSTHSQGGLTDNDFELASQIDTLS